VASLAAVVAMGIWLLSWIGPGRVLQLSHDRAALEGYMRDLGPRAPVALMALLALQVVAAPIPGHVLGAGSGFLFGTWPGTLYNALGVGAGSFVVLSLARYLGRPFVARLVSPAALLRIDNWAASRGPFFFAAVLLLPFMPDDLVCLAAGLTRIRLLPLLGLFVLARLPGHFLSAWIGAHAAGASWQVWLTVGIFAALLLLATWRCRPIFRRWIEHDPGGSDIGPRHGL